MYKIQKEANLIYQTTCSRCGSVFNYDNEEIYLIKKGSNPEAKFVECPICGCINAFNSHDAVGINTQESGKNPLNEFFKKLMGDSKDK